MDSNSNYSQFIEHSFRRLTLLIQQQDTTATPKKKSEQSSSSSSVNNNELVSFSSKIESHKPSINDNRTNAIEPKVKVQPISSTRRTYMRPPKNRITISHRYSSSQCSDRSETSFNHSSNSPCSPSARQQESNELPIHKPYEQTLYDVKFERDRQNDVRQKYNIPSPFQRKWLRQPRYVPQERPKFGQIQRSQNQ